MTGVVVMYKVMSEYPDGQSSSRVGEMVVSYADLELAFGKPMESDGHKVSGEWCFVNFENGALFTIYDWKSTSLYDPSGPSVEAFRANPNPVTFNVGGNGIGITSEFIALVKRQIEWAKVDAPFQEVVLGVGQKLLPGFTADE